MEDKMEQTQQDIPLLTNDNAREDTRENNPFSHSQSTETENPGGGGTIETNQNSTPEEPMRGKK